VLAKKGTRKMSKQLTALEIANELENRFYNIHPAQQAVSMLRSQQAEIERLSNDNYKFIKAMANKDSHIESLKQLLNDSALRKAQEK
jgi:hypothetical protein